MSAKVYIVRTFHSPDAAGLCVAVENSRRAAMKVGRAAVKWGQNVQGGAKRFEIGEQDAAIWTENFRRWAGQ